MAAPAELRADYAHYRESTIGKALCDALDDLTERGLLTQEQAVRALQEFDVHANKHLAQQEQLDPMVCLVEGEISSYRNVQEVWHWHLREATFRFGTSDVAAKKATELELRGVRVVAADAFPGRVYGRGAKKKKSALAGNKVVITKRPKKKKKQQEDYSADD